MAAALFESRKLINCSNLMKSGSDVFACPRSIACKLPKPGSVRILRGFRVGAVFGSLPCKLPKPGSARILRGSAQMELVKEHGPEINFRKADPNKSVSFTKWTIWRPKRSKPDPWPFRVSAARILRGFRVGAGFGPLACKLPKLGSARLQAPGGYRSQKEVYIIRLGRDHKSW